jgi:F-type H+-transporting ATPase subunit epsilon
LKKKKTKQAMSMPYWRAAGMTYVGYANACAVLVRKCMKEPFKSQTTTRERVHFKLSQWLDGVAQPPSMLIPLLLLLLLLLMLSSSSSSSSSSSYALFFFFFCPSLQKQLLLFLFLFAMQSIICCSSFFSPPSYITPIPIGRES